MNENLNALIPSGIRRFTALAKATPGCVGLTIGEPDFDTPQPIREAARAALDAGLTHYAPNRGSQRLLDAITRYETNRGLQCESDRVIVTVGATGALYTAITGILNPGDEVIIPTPAFSLYESITLAAGGRPVFLDLKQWDFQIDESGLEAAVTGKTRAIVINSPCNPTGVTLTKKSLEAVVKAAKAHDLYVICDNVYMGLSEPGTPDLSTDFDLGERLLYCQSFSKPYAMTGWRIGYLIAPKELSAKLLLLHAANLASVPTFIQEAAVTALDTDVFTLAEVFRKRRAYVAQRLREMGLTFPEPGGAFYLFPSIENYTMDDEAFCIRMIQEAGLAAVPGSCFGCPGHIRLSCCYSDEELEEGLNRLEKFLRAF